MAAVEEQLNDLGLGHRYLVEGNYKIIYRIEEDKVTANLADKKSKSL